MTEEEKRRQRCCIVCGNAEYLRHYKQQILRGAVSRSVQSTIRSGVCTFIVPYRNGYEAEVVSSIMRAKKKKSGIRIIVVKPSTQRQCAPSVKERAILQACDMAFSVDVSSSVFQDIALDRWMVDHSSVLILVQGNDRDEDINTLVTYAEEHGVTVIDCANHDMLRRSWEKEARMTSLDGCNPRV